MWFFVDESWSPDNYSPKFGILLGVLIKDEQLTTLDKYLFNTRKKYFGRAHAKNSHYELKGKDLLSSYVLKLSKNAKVLPNNICVIKEILSCPIHIHNFYIKIFASTVYSGDDRHPRLLSPDPREIAEPFKRLIENVSAAAYEDVPGRKVTLVFDQRMGVQKDIAISIHNYVSGMGLKNIETYPYFAVSNVSPGVQFADVMASLLSKRAQDIKEVMGMYNDMRKLCWESTSLPKRYGLMRFDERFEGGKVKYVPRKKW